MMLFVWILASAFPAQPGRWLIAGMTVGVGIALAVVIHKVNRSALGEFGRAMDMVNGQASAQLVMASGDFSDQVFDDIVSRQHDLGIQAVNPVLARQASSLRILGLDIFQASRVTTSLMPAVEGNDRQQLFADDAIFLSSAALNELNVAVGDTIALPFGEKTQSFRVAARRSKPAYRDHGSWRCAVAPGWPRTLERSGRHRDGSWAGFDTFTVGRRRPWWRVFLCLHSASGNRWDSPARFLAVVSSCRRPGRLFPCPCRDKRLSSCTTEVWCRGADTQARPLLSHCPGPGFV